MYLGVDQSATSTGVAVVDRDGALVHRSRILPRKLREGARLAYIRDALVDVLRKYRVTFAAAEGYSLESVNRPFTLGEVGAVPRLVCFDHGIPLVLVQPTALKKFVTGNGGAKKEQIRIRAREKWGADIDQNDEADAFGLAQVARVFDTRETKNRAELEVVYVLAKQFPLS